MINNFLLLNSDKTEILLIGPKNSTHNILDNNLQLEGCNAPSSKVKNLGVILDSNLSFENHISHVTKTVPIRSGNSSHPHPECWIPVNFQATTENSSLSTLLDYIKKYI